MKARIASLLTYSGIALCPLSLATFCMFPSAHTFLTLLVSIPATFAIGIILDILE